MLYQTIFGSAMYHWKPAVALFGPGVARRFDSRISMGFIAFWVLKMVARRQTDGRQYLLITSWVGTYASWYGVFRYKIPKTIILRCAFGLVWHASECAMECGYLLPTGHVLLVAGRLHIAQLTTQRSLEIRCAKGGWMPLYRGEVRPYCASWT